MGVRERFRVDFFLNNILIFYSNLFSGELGRKLAKTIQEELRSDCDVTGHDASTNNLINYIREKRM